MLAQQLEEHAEQVVQRLQELALSKDDSIALQGLKLWMERDYGRAVQPTQDLAPQEIPELDALRELSPEELRALWKVVPPLEEGHEFGRPVDVRRGGLPRLRQR